MTAPGRLRALAADLAAPLAALAVALVLALTPAFADLERGWTDTGLRLLAPDRPVTSALVVDLDEASLRALAPTAGRWPFGRDVHAAAAQRLFDAGARAVVFNLVFTDARPGDAELARVAARPPAVVFGAEVRREAGTDTGAEVRLAGLAWPPGASLPATSWAGAVLPAADVLPPRPRLGVVQAPLDSDGRLRCATLLHRVGQHLLPSLTLAAIAAAQDEPAPQLDAQDGGRLLRAGVSAWPVDARSCTTPVLPARADAVPVLPYAALGAPLNADAARQVRGRTAFVGSPSLLDAPVMTPLGQVGGTVWQALTYDALATGRVLRNRSAAADAGLVLLALLPCLWHALRRGAPTRVAVLASCGLLLLLPAVAVAALLALSQPVVLPLALLTTACGLGAVAWRHQRQLAEQRNRALVDRAAAQAAERAKSEFLAHMSHEIRTPLNAVLGVAQLLAESPLSSQQRRYVETFDRAGRHLSRIVDDVLELSRLQAGALPLASEAFGLGPLVDEVAALFESTARTKGLGFATRIDPGCPATVRGDRHRVRQVLMNLLGNAVKFTERGEVRLDVAPAAPDRLSFTVTDTGIGIDAEALPHVFEPFAQAGTEVARRYGGTGLGLTITQRLARAMGGGISLDSAPGRGTAARLELPLPATDEPLPVAPPSPAEPLPAFAGRRVLLAEDNEFNVLVLEAMLSGMGLTVDVARDGLEAVRCAARTRYDLVLMDQQMPELDGLAATREIRAAERAAGRQPMPVIALSANSAPEDARASRDAGCVAHLGKPVDKGELQRAIAAHLASAEPPAPEASAPMGHNLALLETARTLARQHLRVWADIYCRHEAAGDRDACHRQVHDLRGIALMIGANSLAEAAAGLESAWCSARDPEAARNAVLVELEGTLARLGEQPPRA